MEKGMKIFIACAVGGGIGTAVGLSFYHNVWFFILGVLVGSFTGYFSYEFKEVISAVRIAWKSVVGWRPDRAIVKNITKISVLTLGCFVTVWTITALPLIMSALLVNKTGTGIRSGQMAAATVISLVAFVFVFAFAGGFGDDWEKDKAVPVFKKMIPVYFHCYLLFFLFPKLLWICTKNTGIFIWKMPGFVKNSTITISKFIRTVFVLIHSEERLLVLTDAGIGVIIGCFLGHIIIGALAGGVIGFLNWEIVSKRILKVVPIKSV